MTAPRYSAADYTSAALALRPAGAVWPDDPAATQVKTFGAIGETLARIDGSANGLLIDAFPTTTANLLPEWEATLGLPDPCSGPNATMAQRQAAVRARFIGGGGQSAARYVAFSATLGFTVTITTYAPFRVGFNHVGDPLYSDEWAYAWAVIVTANNGGLSLQALACELRAIAPAHTALFVGSAYSFAGYQPTLRFNEPRNSMYL